MKKIFLKKYLKEIETINIDEYEINEDDLQLFEKFKNLPKIDYRLYECEYENYEYLDLSNMNLNYNDLKNIIDNHKNYFDKIGLLELSNNNLTSINLLNVFSNIKYISVDNNKLTEIINSNVLELDCENNNIVKLITPNVKRLVINNNPINVLDSPELIELDLCDTNFCFIPYFKKLEYLKCSINKISNNYIIKKVEKFKNVYYVEF